MRTLSGVSTWGGADRSSSRCVGGAANEEVAIERRKKRRKVGSPREGRGKSISSLTSARKAV